MLSIIIPGYKDPYHEKTVRDLLENSELGDQMEIISVFDGYWPTWEMVADPRRRIVHLGKNRGMRGAINAGVSVARGEFLMRTDEHCSFGKGYDRILTEQCEPNWIVTPRRYFLNPETWTVMDIPPVDYMKLKIVDCGNGVKKFSGVEAAGNEEPLQESQAMQGSCWVMPRKWWDEVIGELQTEGYGPLYQDSHEMVFKTWKAGGKLMVNRNTWHAHKHRSFSRTHNDGTVENPANKEAGWKYAIDTWGDYYAQLKNDSLLFQ